MTTTKMEATHVAYDDNPEAPTRVSIRNLGVFWQAADGSYTFTPQVAAMDPSKGQNDWPLHLPNPDAPFSRHRKRRPRATADRCLLCDGHGVKDDRECRRCEGTGRRKDMAA